ncbi:unnamed protein product, partial [Amoebophrya sp. A25]
TGGDSNGEIIDAGNQDAPELGEDGNINEQEEIAAPEMNDVASRTLLVKRKQEVTERAATAALLTG